MTKRTLSVDLPEDLSDEFIKTVSEVGGRWRSQRPQETFESAVESAVCAALTLFLNSLSGENKLPDFREYARVKYPELDEDTITKFADLVEQQTGK
jgi:hypothetical protein